MKVYQDKNIQLNDTVVALGKFDGFHLGHAKLIAWVRKLMKAKFTGVLFTFDMKPNKIFDVSGMKNIYTLDEKIQIASEYGVDAMVLYPFDDDFADMTPKQFIEKILVGELGVRFVVVGTQYRFGKGRKGTVETLQKYADTYDYVVIPVEEVEADGKKVSSTTIREALSNGNIALASKLLGRPYAICGQVVEGRQLGRTIGIPTANIAAAPQKLYPPAGVYSAKVYIDGDEDYYCGITNIGNNPTVSDGQVMTIETHIFDFNEDIYGKNIRVELVSHIRSEMKFDNVDALKTQMLRDMDKARADLKIRS